MLCAFIKILEYKLNKKISDTINLESAKLDDGYSGGSKWIDFNKNQVNKEIQISKSGDRYEGIKQGF